MNKMVKLPLFLGICGSSCAALLAAIFSLTNPVIEKTKQTNAAKSYVDLYQQFQVELSDIVVEDETHLSDDLFNIGCSSRAIINKVQGIAYTCEVQGYSTTSIHFQVAFAQGNYIGYSDLGNGESSGFGKEVIAFLPSLLVNLSANHSLLSYDPYTKLIAGKSITGKALATAIEVCRNDYMKWYATT